MAVSINRASRLGLVGGLLGISIIIFVWGVDAFGGTIPDHHYVGKDDQSILIGLVAGIVAISSVLVPPSRPIFIGLVLLIGAVTGFIVTTAEWIVPCLIMLVGAYYAVRAISRPEILLATPPSKTLRYSTGCLVLFLLFGLLILIISLPGQNVGRVFTPATFSVPTPTLKP